MGFANEHLMVEYVRLMFWLDQASHNKIRDGLESYLGVEKDAHGCRFNLELQSIISI